MSNPRYANGHRRRQARARLLATTDVCAICGRPIDKTLGRVKTPQGGYRWDPMAPEVDEIVPISMGGSPTDMGNLRLVHRICNQRRGNRVAPPARRVEREKVFKTSQEW